MPIGACRQDRFGCFFGAVESIVRRHCPPRFGSGGERVRAGRTVAGELIVKSIGSIAGGIGRRLDSCFESMRRVVRPCREGCVAGSKRESCLREKAEKKNSYMKAPRQLQITVPIFGTPI